jgi:predicted dehydrogenase
MHAVVVGQGSIGQRHARLLGELGLKVTTVSRHLPAGPTNHATLEAALALGGVDYVVVATPTGDHRDALSTLQAANYLGLTLVEKPLVARLEEAVPRPPGPVFVAYNLRFHPALQRLKRELVGQTLLSASAYAGQYLPQWRPQQDHRQSYSASPEAGGGVLRDLSHELDYLTWLLGPWQRVTGAVRHTGTLEIRSEDAVSMIARAERCPALHLELNYLDRVGQRTLTIHTSTHTYALDLVRGELRVDHDRQTFDLDRDATYRSQHRAVLAGDITSLCTFEEGLTLVRLIQQLETMKGADAWTALQ